jgi:ribosome biogenesis GTPase A
LIKLFRKKIVKSTPLPCTTKSVNGFKINDTPLLYLVDTPGICVPRIESDEVALKLSLTGCIKVS